MNFFFKEYYNNLKNEIHNSIEIFRKFDTYYENFKASKININTSIYDKYLDHYFSNIMCGEQMVFN